VVRAGRAYLAGVGSTGSLLAGAAFMFIVASALVAFHGWPHLAVQPSPAEVVISRSASTARTPLARRPIGAPAGTSAPVGVASGLGQSPGSGLGQSSSSGLGLSSGSGLGH